MVVLAFSLSVIVKNMSGAVISSNHMDDNSKATIVCINYCEISLLSIEGKIYATTNR